MPDQIRKLDLDHRGFPVPWFVAYIDGKPDFRIVGAGKIAEAHRKSLCWTCGQKLGRIKAFVIGPMCAINRISSEPPSHPQCAEFSARACPFLTQPKMRRNGSNLPEDTRVAGDMIARNPGVALVWWTLGYDLLDAGNGALFQVRKPERTQWFAQGREATRSEILASIESGLPILRRSAELDGSEALAALAHLTAEGMKLVPLGRAA